MDSPYRPLACPSVSAAPSPTRRALRWGLGDVVWVWFAGLVVGAIVGSIARRCGAGPRGCDPDGIDLAVGLFAQNGAILVALLVVVSRTKGLRDAARGTSASSVRARDWPWLAVGRAAPGGLDRDRRAAPDRSPAGSAEQQAADTRRSTARGPELVLVVLGVALFAPLVEELLFRGLLLRALLRRTTPVVAVVISSVVFAGVHLLDPSTAPLMAPLLLLAVISGDSRGSHRRPLAVDPAARRLQPALRGRAPRPPEPRSAL